MVIYGYMLVSFTFFARRRMNEGISECNRSSEGERP
jgi:hypothetical protein